MRKLFALTITFLLTMLLSLPTSLKAQQQMVVVTQQGDLQVYPASAIGGFQYNADQDVYTMIDNGETITFSGKDIKQIYFTDKAETDNDPYIIPAETDKYNPNFEHPEVGTYEILSMDKDLCRTQVKFQGNVPQLYVGKILSLEDDERSYNLYVLTYKVKGKTADIRFRFARIEELLYNTEIVLSTNPNDSYFSTANARGEQLPVYGPRRETELASIDIDGGKMTMYADMGITLDTQDKSSLGIDAKMKLTVPRQNEKSKRSFLAKIEYMGVVAKGTYQKTTTLTMKPKVGLKFDKDKYRDKPIFKALPMKFGIPVGPVVIPVTLDLSGTLGYNISADINAEIELQQQTTTGLTMTAGIEYNGSQTTPIFNVTPIFNSQLPKIVSKQGTVMARFSPYLRIDLLIDVVFGSHLDLMPYMQATYKGIECKGVDDFGSFELEAGGNLRGGLYLNLPFLDNDDYASAMTNDPVKKVIYKSPSNIERKDKKVTYCSMNVEDTRQFQTYATHDGEDVIPEWGQEQSVMQCMETDMPDGQIIEVMGDGSALARALTPISPPLPAIVELHQTGEEWATQCDENGIANTTFKSQIPLGYRTILKTRIMDGDGNTIKELSEEMPTEVRNFNATVSIGGETGTIQYRNGGQHVDEVLAGVQFRFRGSKPEVLTPIGWQPFEGDTPIAAAMHLHQPQVLQIYDYCRWMKDVLNHPTSGLTFSDTEQLGYKCKKVTIPEGSLTYWQNIMMEIKGGDGDFRITSIEILDDYANEEE